MKSGILFVIVLQIFAVMNASAKNYELFSTQRPNNEGILVERVMEVPERVLSKQQKLDLLTDEVPLLPGQAAKAAHKKFKALYNRESLGVHVVWLKEISGLNEEFNHILYYDVRFYDRDVSAFVVLMDGTVVTEKSLNN